jgi:uncharacterized protein
MVANEPSFQFAHESEPNETLLAGFASFGLAGLTAVDFLVDQLGLEQTGHVEAEELPAITPFQNGVARHHTRLFGGPEGEITLLVGELFIPTTAAGVFARAIDDWLDARSVSEVTVLSGVPIAHGPDDHRAFYIATEDYRDSRLADTDIAPMPQGFLDGVNAELVGRAIDSPLRAGVLTTPVHPQAPDVEAAIRLVEATNEAYGLDVDTGPLQEFASEVHQHYRNLAERFESMEEEQSEDRMYM